MAFSSVWNYLPSVIIFNIYTHLSARDRLNASSTCKSWRECVYHYSQWPSKNLSINLCSQRHVRNNRNTNTHTNTNTNNVTLKLFIAKCCRFIHDINISFDINRSSNINDLIDIINILSSNANDNDYYSNRRSVRRIGLNPVNVCSNAVNWHLLSELMKSLEVLIGRCVSLEHVSLGCLQHMLNDWPILMSKLGSVHGHSLKCLHLSSIKQNPDYYPVLDMSTKLFEPFLNIAMISIDYDNISDDLLLLFANKGTLNTLIISIHGIDEHHNRLSKSSWTVLRRSNANLKVTVNLMHTDIDESKDILRDSIFDTDMPLTHFRAYFVSMNVGSGEAICDLINLISLRHPISLNSVTIVDNLRPYSKLPNNAFAKSRENPLVLLAWRCKLLNSITVIGFDVCETDLIAITRLRGSALTEFKFPSCCISFLTDGESYYDDKYYLDFAPLSIQRQVIENIAKPLNREWSPLYLDELPNAVLNRNDFAQTTYLPTILMDQNSCLENSINNSRFNCNSKA